MPCQCKVRPMCESRACNAPAAWSVMTLPRCDGPRPKFMCQQHRDLYMDRTPIRGLDRPPGASDEWRPSLLTAIHLADMEINRQDKAGVPPEMVAPSFLLSRQRDYTPAQLSQLAHLRRALSTSNQTEPK